MDVEHKKELSSNKKSSFMCSEFTKYCKKTKIKGICNAPIVEQKVHKKHKKSMI